MIDTLLGKILRYDHPVLCNFPTVVLLHLIDSGKSYHIRVMCTRGLSKWPCSVFNIPITHIHKNSDSIDVTSGVIETWDSIFQRQSLGRILIVVEGCDYLVTDCFEVDDQDSDLTLLKMKL